MSRKNTPPPYGEPARRGGARSSAGQHTTALGPFGRRDAAPARTRGPHDGGHPLIQVVALRAGAAVGGRVQRNLRQLLLDALRAAGQRALRHGGRARAPRKAPNWVRLPGGGAGGKRPGARARVHAEGPAWDLLGAAPAPIALRQGRAPPRSSADTAAAFVRAARGVTSVLRGAAQMPPRSSRASLAAPPAKPTRHAAKAAAPQPAAATAGAKRGVSSRTAASTARSEQIGEPDEPPAPATQPPAAAETAAAHRKTKAKAKAAAEQAAPAEAAAEDSGRPKRARVPPKPLPITAPLTAAERAEARAGSDVKARSYEARWWAQGSARVAGVDEAGRGPLAGPVVAAACIIPSNVHIVRTRGVSAASAPLRGCSSANKRLVHLACGQVGVADSKQLSEEQREALYEKLTTHPQVRAAWSRASCANLIQHLLLSAPRSSGPRASSSTP